MNKEDITEDFKNYVLSHRYSNPEMWEYNAARNKEHLVEEYWEGLSGTENVTKADLRAIFDEIHRKVIYGN